MMSELWWLKKSFSVFLNHHLLFHLFSSKQTGPPYYTDCSINFTLVWLHSTRSFYDEHMTHTDWQAVDDPCYWSSVMLGDPFSGKTPQIPVCFFWQQNALFSSGTFLRCTVWWEPSVLKGIVHPELRILYYSSSYLMPFQACKMFFFFF